MSNLLNRDFLDFFLFCIGDYQLDEVQEILNFYIVLFDYFFLKKTIPKIKNI